MKTAAKESMVGVYIIYIDDFSSQPRARSVLLTFQHLAANFTCTMHGNWELEEDLFISPLRLGTSFFWGKIEQE